MVKNPPASTEDVGSILESGRYPGEGMGTHSNIPAQEFGERSLASYSLWGHKEYTTEHTCVHAHTHTHTHLLKFLISRLDYLMMKCRNR